MLIPVICKTIIISTTNSYFQKYPIAEVAKCKSVDFGDQLGGAPAEALEAVKRLSGLLQAYLIFVIFFTRAKFLANKIYIETYTVNYQFT